MPECPAGNKRHERLDEMRSIVRRGVKIALRRDRRSGRKPGLLEKLGSCHTSDQSACRIIREGRSVTEAEDGKASVADTAIRA